MINGNIKYRAISFQSFHSALNQIQPISFNIGFQESDVSLFVPHKIIKTDNFAQILSGMTQRISCIFRIGKRNRFVFFTQSRLKNFIQFRRN